MKKGFTLIELLVVISIISLLSTVVMASLNSSRAKAQEAAIKSDLQSIKTQAELSYSKTGNYSNVATEIAPIIAHINANGGTTEYISSNQFNYYSEEYKHYAVSVKFNSDSNKNWSVSDQFGVATWDVSDLLDSVTWTTANANCEILGKRLPTVEEFKSLQVTGGTTNDRGFGDVYWTSTKSPEYSSVYLIFSPVSGGWVFVNDSSLNRVRCIR